MLIFDKFADMNQAQAFATAVGKQLKLKTHVCKSQEESNKLDIFPFELHPPIVLVDRADEKVEKAAIALAKQYGAEFAGT